MTDNVQTVINKNLFTGSAESRVLKQTQIKPTSLPTVI